MNETNNFDLFGNPVQDSLKKKTESPRREFSAQKTENLPEKLGKAIRLPVPDFNDPNRKPTCLEVDFPIAQINALSNLEGNAGKPIYQMSKWWARRRSSVFRSMLIAAATEAPEDRSEAAKKVWDHYYCNHQKAGSFKNLRVLDCFMGGGTTLVEGSRLGMQMTGVDLNPVAWFVVKNELACSDPEQVKMLFEQIEREVKPQIQPFYTTTCPRGHTGKWVSVETGEVDAIDPIDLPPEERKKYRWEGPEIIYTFWAKHGPCLAKGCGHRTPIFRTPVIAEKKLSTSYVELTCPDCGNRFHAELGETRMAPGAERVVLEGDALFTELSQPFAKLLNDYDKGSADETVSRIAKLKDMVADEPGLKCPACQAFAGRVIAAVLEKHYRPAAKNSERKKKAFDIKKKKVQMYLLIDPAWMKGAAGFNGEEELGGYAGAPADVTAKWNTKRLDNLGVIEVRGCALPESIVLQDGTVVECGKGTVPKQAQFTCSHCGKTQDRLSATKMAHHTAPIAAYAFQCHCPQCQEEGYTYNGRYFKTPDAEDIQRMNAAEHEWEAQKEQSLSGYWPRMEIPFSMRTHVKDPLPDHGYTHWWMMFNSRQLLVHAQLLKSITEADENAWALDVREQALGAFQQYLRMMCMFSFWHQTYDKLAPALSNSNFNPKSNVVETSPFGALGYGRWPTCASTVDDAQRWLQNPWELIVSASDKVKSDKCFPGDGVISSQSLHCGSSTNLERVSDTLLDLVITDPPFGDNLYYADLADFFYVWLRIPLLKWYEGLPERKYFEPERTPHSMEAIDNAAEHPDDREEHEKSPFVEKKHLQRIIELTQDTALQIKDPNPLYRPVPSSEFYSQTLSACWAEAGRLLKPGGIMAFTFHHSEDQAWIDILRALFDAGYLLVATYPIRSDESKGETAQFGSKKIEYDIIHVCRKRLGAPEPVSWARMRRWVKEETIRLKELLEHTHGKELPESDLRVILRGKSLEFYSRHYGQVFTGDGQVLAVRDALLGINQLLDDLLEDTSQTGGLRPPDSAEPSSRLYLKLFHTRVEMDRDELHKTLRGSGISQGDLEALGWIRAIGRIVHVVPIAERFEFFTASGRNRKVIKSDLDQTHFLIGAAQPKSGIKIETELNNPNFRIKRAVDEILGWYAATTTDDETKIAARTAAQIVEHWRSRRREQKPETQQLSLFEQLESEV